MKRDVSSLTEKEYDLVVIGGGISGVCIAWDAALRGLSVALIERGDFAQAASANCFKIVHGGIRYLQHGDIHRIRESSRERTALLRIAPHLVQPLPILVPTYGRSFKSKEFLRLGMALYDLITLDRNRGISSPDRSIPSARPLSREKCLDSFPGLAGSGLTGGMLFHDGQMYSSSRLALAFLQSAVSAGAQAANYVEATSLVWDGKRVSGVDAHDTLTGDRVQVRGKVTINAAGGWAPTLLEGDNRLQLHPEPTFSRDTALVVKRQLTEKYALAVQGTTRDPDAMLSRGNRHLFMVPWRGYTLVGVWHGVYQGDPNLYTVTREEVQRYLDEFNAAYRLDSPLTVDDVSLVNAGLVLFGENQAGATDLSYGKRSMVVDHSDKNGVDGLVTAVSVRYTTARGVAEKVLDLAFKKLGRRSPMSETATTPIHGGNVEDFGRFSRQAVDSRPQSLPPNVMYALLRSYGSAYQEVLHYLDGALDMGETLGTSQVIKAEVIHAVRNEMAQKLSDVVFRRTDLGTGGHPGEAALTTCADLMAAELGWTGDKKREELAEVQSVFPLFGKEKFSSLVS